MSQEEGDKNNLAKSQFPLESHSVTTGYLNNLNYKMLFIYQQISVELKIL